MTATIPYIERKFEEFNRQMFAGQLPKIPVMLSDAGSFLGKCVYKVSMGKDGKKEFYDFKLRINKRADLPERELEDVLIHEMIHYYIGVNRLEDTSSHGPLFTHIMNSINKRFGRDIKVSFQGTKEQKELLVDKRRHIHVVALVKLHDGRTGMKVLPRVAPSILKFYNIISSSREVEAVELFMSDDILFNRYPNSSTPKMHLVDEAEIRSHLQDAVAMVCDGRKIRIKNKE